MNSRLARACYGTGVVTCIPAIAGVVAILPSWMEFGRWTVVLTWFSVGSVAVGLLGFALILLSERIEKKAVAKAMDRWATDQNLPADQIEVRISQRKPTPRHRTQPPR